MANSAGEENLGPEVLIRARMHAISSEEVVRAHYTKLIKAHRLFYGGYEYRAPYYDDYMKRKN